MARRRRRGHAADGAEHASTPNTAGPTRSISLISSIPTWSPRRLRRSSITRNNSSAPISQKARPKASMIRQRAPKSQARPNGSPNGSLSIPAKPSKRLRIIARSRSLRHEPNARCPRRPHGKSPAAKPHPHRHHRGDSFRRLLYPKVDQIDGNCALTPKRRAIVAPEMTSRVERSWCVRRSR